MKLQCDIELYSIVFFFPRSPQGCWWERVTSSSICINEESSCSNSIINNCCERCPLGRACLPPSWHPSSHNDPQNPLMDQVCHPICRRSLGASDPYLRSQPYIVEPPPSFTASDYTWFLEVLAVEAWLNGEQGITLSMQLWEVLHPC